MRTALVIVGVVSALFWASVGRAESLPETDVIRAILGEGEGEPYAGKLALAYAIGNRGTLDGVYGKRAVIAKEGQFYRGSRPISSKSVKDALRALKEARQRPTLDPTKGSRHWENIKAFGVPYWAEGKTPVYTVGSHAFYNDVK